MPHGLCLRKAHVGDSSSQLLKEGMDSTIETEKNMTLFQSPAPCLYKPHVTTHLVSIIFMSLKSALVVYSTPLRLCSNYLAWKRVLPVSYPCQLCQSHFLPPSSVAIATRKSCVLPLPECLLTLWTRPSSTGCRSFSLNPCLRSLESPSPWKLCNIIDYP